MTTFCSLKNDLRNRRNKFRDSNYMRLFAPFLIQIYESIIKLFVKCIPFEKIIVITHSILYI